MVDELDAEPDAPMNGPASPAADAGPPFEDELEALLAGLAPTDEDDDVVEAPSGEPDDIGEVVDDGSKRISLELKSDNFINLQNLDAAICGRPDLNLFQMGGYVYRARQVEIKVPGKNGTTRNVRVPGLVEVRNPDAMRVLIDRAVSFYKLAASDDGEEPKIKTVSCPVDLAKMYLHLGDWKLRVITGLIQCPTLRGPSIAADGYTLDPASSSILQTNGYDENTGLLMVLDGTFPAVPDAPTEKQVKKALKYVTGFLDEFCFTDESSRMGAVAAMLSGVLRPHYEGGGPMFCAEAYERGSGKSTLARIISAVVSGGEPARPGESRSSEEFEKAMAAVLMEGHAVICQENVTTLIGNSFLAKCLTEDVVTPRVLGKSMTRTVSTRRLFILTGNNIEVDADVGAGRALIMKLDKQGASINYSCKTPVKRAKEHRRQIVAALLTIVRGYATAGSPKPAYVRDHRLTEWNALVAAPLAWAWDVAFGGQTTLDECFLRAEEAVSVTESSGPVIVELVKTVFGVSKAFSLDVEKLNSISKREGEDDAHVAARQALGKALQEGGTHPVTGKYSHQWLAQWFRSAVVGQPSDGHRIVKLEGSGSNARFYKVERMSRGGKRPE